MSFMEAIQYKLLSGLNEDLKDVIRDNSIFSITDSLGRIEYANKDYCEILEREQNSLIGESHDLLKSHLHTDKIYKNLWRTIKMGNKWNGILNDKSASGKQFWLDTTIIPVRDDVENTMRYVALYKDVTKSQLKNYQLIESNISHSRYRSIYQSIHLGIIILIDDEGNITEWNKGAELAFGYSQVEILGYPLTVLMSNEFRKPNIKELIKLINKIKSNQDSDSIEACCLTKSGVEFPVELAMETLNVNNSNFYCVTMLDLTKSKKTENNLEQKNRNLELLLYRTIHDLKAPLSSAEGLINLLKDEPINERAKKLSNMLETTINKGKDLVESLTHASNYSNKIIESKIINFDIIIDDVLKMLSSSKDFELFEINTDIINNKNYKSNPEWISSIFQNLIHNAIKYYKIPSKNHSPEVNIFVTSLSDNIVINVSDNGKGISEESIANIFDLYYRVDNKDVPGNGLGLYIVKNIVEDLGGTISVESEINKGASFEIIIPNLSNTNQYKTNQL